MWSSIKISFLDMKVQLDVKSKQHNIMKRKESRKREF